MLFFLIPFLLTWGSFLNMLGYRLLRPRTLYKKRSFCPHCKKTIAWYDLIPIISWFVLGGSCRDCKKNISFLYPLIEIITCILGFALFVIMQPSYLFYYCIFFSALIITIRTDLETMLISRWVTIYLMPIMILLSFTTLSPLTPIQSIIGALSGYGFLFIVAQLFYFFTKKHGLGQGDVELIAFIGSALGFYGWWSSILVGSLLGSCIGLIYIVFTKSKASIKIPFGPFLALGAFAYVFFMTHITSFIH